MSPDPATPSSERHGLRVVGPVKYAAERQRLILAAARSDGRVEVTELAHRLHVTGETIRRDLTVLERRRSAASPAARSKSCPRAAPSSSTAARPPGHSPTLCPKAGNSRS